MADQSAVADPEVRVEGRVEVRVLGPVELVVDGRVVALARLQRNVVIALALAGGRTVTTDALIDALWEGDPPDTAMGTLQSYVSVIRKAIGDRDRAQPVLARHGEGYALDIDPDGIDAVRFERLVAEARGCPPAEAEPILAEALSAWRGPALGEAATETFARPAAARLDELRLAATEARFDAALELGHHARLVHELEALVGEHPLRERLTGQLVIALYRSGRQADALRAYERTRRRLADEMGLSPSPELMAIERAVLDQTLDLPAAAVAPAVADEPAAPAPAPTELVLPIPPAVLASRRLTEFVGRRTELDRIAGAWAASETKGRRVLAVSGEPGIGKTRLVGELAALAHAEGGIVMWGACTVEALEPFQPFVEAMRPLADALGPSVLARNARGAAALARLLPELAPEGGTAANADDRAGLFDAVAAVLAGRRALLVLDDLHWADASTCALVVHLARHPALNGLLIAATYRPAEAQRPNPLADALAELRRHRLIEQLPLTGLDDSATLDLVQALAGDRAGELAPELHQRSEGNPFFVEELVTHALEHGGEDSLPAGVRDIVDRRLAEVDDADRRVLAAAAVLGRSFDVDLLAAVTGRSAIELVDPLEAAVDLYLLVEAAPPVGRFAFAHALIRDGLLEGMTVLRRSQLHRAAADAVEATSLGDDDRVSEVAHHLVAAGAADEVPRTVSALLRAARRALELLSYDEAAVSCETALGLLDGSADAVSADLWQVLGETRVAQGRADDARLAFREAAALARAGGDGARLANAAFGLGSGSGIGVSTELGVVDEERVGWLDDALVLLGDTNPEVRVRALSHLATALYDGDPQRRDEISLLALDEAEQLGDKTLLSAAHIARRIALWYPAADMDERLVVGAKAVEYGDVEGDPLYRIVTRFGAIGDLLEAAALDHYRIVLGEVLAIALPMRQPRWTWFCDVARAGPLLAEGYYEEAEELVEHAIEIVGDAIGFTPFVTHSAQRFLLERDLGQAEATVARLGPIVAAVPQALVARAALALALFETGDADAARAELDVLAADRFGAVRPDYLWLITMMWSAEAASGLGEAETAAVLLDLLDGYDERLAVVGGAVVAGLISRARGLLAATTGDLDLAVERLDHSREGHEHLGFRPFAARSSAELAAVLLRRGAKGDAARAAELLAAATAITRATGLRLDRLPLPFDDRSSA